MSAFLTAVLAAQTVLALVMVVFAVRAWSRVRDGRLGFLALGFALLLAEAAALLVATTTDLLTLQEGTALTAVAGLGALLSLYLGVLRP